MNPAVKNENGSPARDPLSIQKANLEHLNTITFKRERSNSVYPFCNSDITSAIHAEEASGIGQNLSCPFISRQLAPEKSENGERLTENRHPFPLSYSRIKAFVECPHRFYLRYFEGLPEAQGEGRKHNGLILRAVFNAYLGNSPTPLLFGENLKRDMEQIEFGVQFLKSKDVLALNIPFALDRFSNPIPFDEPEVVFRGVAQCLYTAPGPETGGSRFVRSQFNSNGGNDDQGTSSDVRSPFADKAVKSLESAFLGLSEDGGPETVNPALTLCHFKAGFGDPDWERLLIYTWALSRVGYNIGRIEWVSLSAGASFSKEITKENLEEAGINLYAWINQILQSDFTPEAGDHCSYCLYHSLCPLMEKLGEDLTISDSDSLKNTLQKTVAFQEGAKKMKKLADEYIDREGIGKVEIKGYEYASDEAPTQIRLLDREAALDTVVGLPDPFKFITFRNLSELVDYLPEEAYEKKEKLKPVRRFRRAAEG
ncbi:hypothetical protein Q502_12340 [Mesotoga sp. Brook.08.YT.4.2.5.2.]|uniref:PD-(D/E)XK nuclease family protein n=1 Tax=unclassified Mesotoga TaxID=1184398 RepID=UPI000DC3D640|nr:MULTISPECIES: PD-(D/E)XK nuclease family protein [unclassified Mesotoga]RAO98311.1 hypothetical protein M388_00330 [Mesotoga sp. Brook.08.YT.4.2.5.4.]RDI90986.1 hypothetical protein Q502_12340 [Mesotoga sp. Brook.08.YT.4.2.5.2.]